MREKTAREEDTPLPTINRARAESAVPREDCSGRVYDEGEREDLIRYVLQGAEIQRDTDITTEFAGIPLYELIEKAESGELGMKWYGRGYIPLA